MHFDFIQCEAKLCFQHRFFSGYCDSFVNLKKHVFSWFQSPSSLVVCNHREANWVCGFMAGGGIQKLHDDVQMCGYQDVQVMWEMVRRSEMELSNERKRRKRLLWRIPTWSNRTSSTDLMDPRWESMAVDLIRIQLILIASAPLFYHQWDLKIKVW